jgi:hypothetical protein
MLGRICTGWQMKRESAPSWKINAAIQAGLAECRKSAAPIVTLAQLIDELHLDPTWSDDEVRLVEKGVRHVLARIMMRPSAAADDYCGMPLADKSWPERRDGNS